MRQRDRAVIAALCVALSALTMMPSRASAGGFYLLERGTRSLGRGGAFVAGADDPSALWINPAGIGFAGEQLVVDATLGFLDVEYTRIDSGGNTMPTVHGTNAPLPIPTIAGTFDFGLEHFHFGAGVFAPNAALMSYPQSLTVDGMDYPAPQRYSLLTMEGSLIATIAVGAAWTPLPDELSIGLAVHGVVGAFAARVALSACDGAICTFPEDPEYDGIAQMNLSPIITASVVGGVTWNPGPVRLGASFSTPFSLSGDASIDVRAPSAAAFGPSATRHRPDAGPCSVGEASDEEVQADPNHPCRDTTAAVNLNFPFILRVGAELLAIENLRLEASFVWETWSMQREVSVVPNDVWIIDALNFLDYEIGAMNIPRNMRDTFSVRLGGEYTIDGSYQIRLGGYFENGSFDDAYLSPLTIDSDKIVVAGGFSMRLFDGVWGDLMVGYAHLFSRQVRDSRVTQQNPIRPPVPDNRGPVYVGNGDYNFTMPFVGVGMRWQADWAAAPAPVEEEPVPSETTPVEDPAVDSSQPWYQQGSGAQAEPVTTVPPGTETPASTEASEEETPDVTEETQTEDRPRRGRGRRGGRGRRPPR
ncbi:OmpP1/FadL family transporter [Sandaracinus amylolyticus]|uniref:OmpP1/FadL family transporter n=1 Tax=Sandaracinus amylolyticus TaxID=927083 RepID=UPI001F3E7D73|nr:outer membrane protein transport protein [Sandaracinus amylolyticus]UJR81159.1 Membrane protein in aromatic hydrocarbon degradation [Sandaracinus amylolyticus]